MGSPIDKPGLGDEAMAERVIEWYVKSYEPAVFNPCPRALKKEKMSSDQCFYLRNLLSDGLITKRERLHLLEDGFSGRFVYRLAEGDALIRRIKWIVRHLDGPVTLFDSKGSRARMLAHLGNLSWPPEMENTIIRSIGRALNDNDQETREMAVWILQGRTNVKIIPILVKGLKDGDWNVRFRACVALEELGAKAIKTRILLEKIAFTDGNQLVRKRAVVALSKMGVHFAPPKN
jgi:hypothetical protein